MEQRIAIKFNVKFGKSTVKTFLMIKTGSGDDCLSERHIYWWHKTFLHSLTLWTSVLLSVFISANYLSRFHEWYLLECSMPVSLNKPSNDGLGLKVLSHASHFRWWRSLITIQCRLHRLPLHGLLKRPYVIGRLVLINNHH